MKICELMELLGKFPPAQEVRLRTASGFLELHSVQVGEFNHYRGTTHREGNNHVVEFIDPVSTQGFAIITPNDYIGIVPHRLDAAAAT